MSSVPEEQLLCPICLEIPSAEIFQCGNGHHICKECKSKVQNCPSCRIAFAGTAFRNLALESILDTMSFECPHLNYGCKLKLNRKELSQHEKVCKFRPIPLCKSIGFPGCNFQFENLPQTNTIHLQGHGIKECCGTMVLLRLQSVQNRLQKWEQALWRLEKDLNSPTFMVFSWTFQNQNGQYLIALAFLYIGLLELDAAKYEIEYSIRHVYGGRKESEAWSVTPIPYTKLGQLLQTPTNTISLQFLTKGVRFNEDRLRREGLQIRLRMKKKPKAVADYGCRQPRGIKLALLDGY